MWWYHTFLNGHFLSSYRTNPRVIYLNYNILVGMTTILTEGGTTLKVIKNCLLSKTKLDNASKKVRTVRINSYRELNDMLSNI